MEAKLHLTLYFLTFKIHILKFKKIWKKRIEVANDVHRTFVV
jgi:hypothetical protein